MAGGAEPTPAPEGEPMLWLLLACAPDEDDVEDCLNEALELWCHHEENAGGPVGSAPCEAPAFVPGPYDHRCGAFDVASDGPNFSGRTMFYDAASGELV